MRCSHASREAAVNTAEAAVHTAVMTPAWTRSCLRQPLASL